MRFDEQMSGECGAIRYAACTAGYRCGYRTPDAVPGVRHDDFLNVSCLFLYLI